MARDFQRQFVYDWENWYNAREEKADQTATMSLEDIKAMAMPMLRYFGYKRDDIEIKDGRGTRCAYAYGDYAMGFPKFARKNWIVAHECAHIIVSHHFGDNRSQKALTSHGAIFVGVYIELLVHFFGYDRQYLKDTAKLGRVKVWDCAPEDIGRYLRRFENA